jgi:hypothetical protein
VVIIFPYLHSSAGLRLQLSIDQCMHMYLPCNCTEMKSSHLSELQWFQWQPLIMHFRNRHYFCIPASYRTMHLWLTLQQLHRFAVWHAWKLLGLYANCGQFTSPSFNLSLHQMLLVAVRCFLTNFSYHMIHLILICTQITETAISLS